MAFVSSTPPKYDCEIFNEVQNQKNLRDEEYDANSVVDYSDKYLVFVGLFFSLMFSYRVYLKEL